MFSRFSRFLFFHLGTLFLRSLYDFLFKNISHHGSFLPLSYKWMGMGWDLCAGLFNEHRFAMLIMLHFGQNFLLKPQILWHRHELRCVILNSHSWAECE